VREVREETGLSVSVQSIAFLREWVVPTYCSLPDAAGRVGYGLEVYLYASPQHPCTMLRPESPTDPTPCWVGLDKIAELPLWPKEVKALAGALASGAMVLGVPSFVTIRASALHSTVDRLERCGIERQHINIVISKCGREW
jgi:hypothetical protein